MKKVSGLSVLLLAGTFVMSPAANAATVLTARPVFPLNVFLQRVLFEYVEETHIGVVQVDAVGGVLLGWFTPTESACVAVIYAALLSIFIYREMDMKQLYHALSETGRLSAVALFCVGTASAFGWLLAYYQIPRALLAGVTQWGMGITGVGFFIAFVFLVVGCFLDAIPAIIIVGTTLEPLARSVDMHPVQFAIIGIVSLAFGLVTPPYGLCLMIACAVAKVRLRYALKDTLIMLVPMLVVLAALIVWPELILILPRLISPEFLK